MEKNIEINRLIDCKVNSQSQKKSHSKIISSFIIKYASSIHTALFLISKCPQHLNGVDTNNMLTKHFATHFENEFLTNGVSVWFFMRSQRFPYNAYTFQKYM